jgi:hypothetical protein
MKKEEFPTFLNEQPTIIFGRTGRELLVITIGLACGFLTWTGLGTFIGGNVVISDIVKAILVGAIVVCAAIVAFIKVATRPLEEWAFVWLFYAIIPKVYLYIPEEVSMSFETQGAQDVQSKSKTPDDDDDFGDEY